MLESTYRPGTLTMLECRFNKTTHHHAGMPPLLLLHATPFPVCQSLARMSLAVYSRCSLARWISYPSLCCMLFCTPPMGQGLSPSNWLHPSGAFSAWPREGHWPPENKPLPGGAGGVALWPSRRLLPGRNGLRTGLTGLNQVPAATRLLDCLKTMLGTLSLYMRPTKGEPFRADKDKRLVCPRRGDRVRGTA